MSMKTIHIRNMPDELHARLKERAKLNRRSVNQQVIVELSRVTNFCSSEDEARKRRRAEEMIESVEKIRRRMAGFLTAEEIDAAKRDGLA